jgi:hypothetical protein
MRELSLDFSPMFRADHDEGPFSWDDLFGPVQCVLEHRAAPSDGAELLNPAPATHLGEKLAHARALASS